MEGETRILGIEGGGTKTEWVYGWQRAGEFHLLREGILGPANLYSISDDALLTLFSVLPDDPDAAGIFLAGCATPRDHSRLRILAERTWPHARLRIGSDRESGFAAAFHGADGIAVIAGTGSAITGRLKGRTEQAGGWGQLLGDRGGGYDLALQALRDALLGYDLERVVTPVGEAILRALALNRLQDLVAWVQTADKMSVAKLAPVVFDAAGNGDTGMLAAVQNGARTLADYTRAVSKRLAFESPRVCLSGGLFVHHSEYCDLYRDYLSDLLPGAHVSVCADSGAFGAAWIAADGGVDWKQVSPPPASEETLRELAMASTEQRNVRSANLDQLSPLEMVDLFVTEESAVSSAISACRQLLAEAIEMITNCLRDGGRLFYVGAGTSGRLGVLDASEMPPTFGTDPALVQGIIAGGAPALYSAVEGAEDDAEGGAFSLVERGLRPGDAVCGITASGRTPFVLGALKKAAESGASTILITCNSLRAASGCWDIEIALPTGPEILTGSTRLKAASATKLALNILSTCSMVRLGRAVGNEMSDLSASNVKLRDRAIRAVSGARKIGYDEARLLLERNGWNVRVSLRKG